MLLTITTTHAPATDLGYLLHKNPARPKTVVVTTPNVEYNVRFDTLPAGKFRHKDHRFEWTRQEFRQWAESVAARFGFGAAFAPVGPEDSEVGPPTQMAVFRFSPPISAAMMGTIDEATSGAAHDTPNRSRL